MKRPRVGWLEAAQLAALLWTACDTGSEVEARAVAADARSPLAIHHLLGDSQSFRQKLSTKALAGFALPTLHLRVHRLNAGVLETTAALHFDRDYTASFVPLVRGTKLPDCRMSLEAVTSHGTLSLWSGPPRFTRTPAHGLDQLAAILDDRVRVSLSILTGDSAALRWRVAGDCVDRVSWIAVPKLRPAPGVQPPASMLLICSDQHRYDRSSSPGARSLMPRLAALGDEGVIYDAAYSAASWTLPSITSALTGLFPRFHHTGLRVHSGDAARRLKGKTLPPGQFLAGWGDDLHVLTAYPDQLTNVAERLQDVGYDSVAVVSNDFYLLSGLLADGFDVVIDMGAVKGGAVNQQALALISRFERRTRDEPLFLLVHYMDVHEYLRDRVPASRSALTSSNLDPEAVRSWYDTEVRDTDRHLGSLVDAWDAIGGASETLVAFYSDHGEHLQEPGHRHDRHGDSMDEVLLQIPLVVRFPASLGVPRGREARPVHLVDLAPTLLEIAGAPVSDGELQGRSLLTLAAEASKPQRSLYADYQLYGDELASVRRGPRKLVIDIATGTSRLIDVEAAASGEHEAERRDASLERALLDDYRSYAQRSDDFARDLSSSTRLDPEDVERRLRAIGYAE